MNKILDDLLTLSDDLLRQKARPYRRYFFDNTLFESPCAILLGARGVGKTTLIAQRLLAEREAAGGQIPPMMVPVDHFRIRSRSLFEVAEAYQAMGGRLLFFDEVHKYQDWQKDIKSIRDQYPKLRMILSGSSAIALQSKTADLSRRAIARTIYGLSFREFLGLFHEIDLPVLKLNALLEDQRGPTNRIRMAVEDRGLKILALFHEYLDRGYFPFALDFTRKELYHDAVSQTVSAAIESDIPSIAPKLTMVGVSRIKRLLAQLATLPPLTCDLKKLLHLTEIADERTLKTYLYYLEQADLIHTLSRTGSGLKSMRKPDKIYLGNPNLVSALAPAGSGQVGAVREIFFSTRCARLIPSPSRTRAIFWSTRKRRLKSAVPPKRMGNLWA